MGQGKRPSMAAFEYEHEGIGMEILSAVMPRLAQRTSKSA